MDTPTQQPNLPSPDQLEAADDDTLRGLIKTAESLIERRATERKQQAIAEIKAIAKATGLNVSVSNTRARKPKERKPKEQK